MEYIPRPLTVECSSCGISAETWDFQNPDRAVECNCCVIAHDHAGKGCRPVIITAHAYLTIFSPEELLEMMHSPEPIQPLKVMEV